MGVRCTLWVAWSSLRHCFSGPLKGYESLLSVWKLFGSKRFTPIGVCFKTLREFKAGWGFDVTSLSSSAFATEIY